MVRDCDSRRHALLGKLTTVQAAVEMLERRPTLSAEERTLIEVALRAIYELVREIRLTFPSSDEPGPTGAGAERASSD